MAEEVFSGGLVMFFRYDLSDALTSVVVDHGAEPLDRTTISDTTRRRVGGLKTSAISAQGYFAAGDQDTGLFSDVGVAGRVVSVSPDTAEGSVAYTLQPLIGEYNPLEGSVGDIAGYSLNVGVSEGDLVRGVIVHNQARTTSGDGNSFQLGAISSDAKLYAAMHVIAASGTSPTLDVDIESDDNSGMSSPVVRASFTQATGTTNRWEEISGPITDDYWRISWTLGGTSPSFTFAVIFGIQ